MTIEFALAVVPLLLLLLAAIDVSRAHVAGTVLAHVTRETARYGAAHLGEADWQAASIRSGVDQSAGIDPSAVSLAVERTTVDGRIYVRVSGSYPFQFVTPALGLIFGSPLMLEAQTLEIVG